MSNILSASSSTKYVTLFKFVFPDCKQSTHRHSKAGGAHRGRGGARRREGGGGGRDREPAREQRAPKERGAGRAEGGTDGSKKP
mmetsp:Transcript_13119/g.25786  ORF Transcript_13119/g.25786 Transcript_13119/m.25786 type:complete len:84 (-) Transcript_13119:1097-1348(-)